MTSATTNSKCMRFPAISKLNPSIHKIKMMINMVHIFPHLIVLFVSLIVVIFPNFQIKNILNNLSKV